MNTKWNDKSWQKEFLNIKAHSPSICKTSNGRCKRLKRWIAFRCSALWKPKIEENTGIALTTIKELSNKLDNIQQKDNEIYEKIKTKEIYKIKKIYGKTLINYKSSSYKNLLNKSHLSHNRPSLE